MFRYIAFVWNAADPVQSAAEGLLRRRLHASSTGWQAAVDCQGLCVLSNRSRDGSSCAIPMHGGVGVVLGTLFERATGRRVTCLSPAESARIVATAGRDLIASYWGRYVALLTDPAAQATWILRDPTGGLPCLHCKYGGVDIYFSFIEDCVGLRLIDFSINWNFLRTRLLSLLLAPTDTAIKEVHELAPGECAESRALSTRYVFYWHPFSVARTNVLEEPREAAAAIRAEAKKCVRAWASCYEHILHRLSGGLDSSIVLGCLLNGQSTPHVTCVNYYSSGANSDERRFARLAAARAGCELIEQERDGDVNLEGMLGIHRSPAPTSYIYSNSVPRKDSGMALSRRIGADAMFGGGGGDQLFYQSGESLAAADYACLHGISRTFLGIALNAAVLERTSIWRVFGVALRHGLLKKRPDLLKGGVESRKLLSAEFVETAHPKNRGPEMSALHPWLAATEFVPPGKLWHVYTLAVPQQFYNPAARSDDPELVTPLISQPIVEVALRTPTYLLTAGRRDRGLARVAFGEDVPDEILRRRTKGGLDDNFKRVLTGNLDFIREMLLHGILAKEGVLDRAKMEAALSGRPSKVVAVPGEIFDYLSIEVWLRVWNSTARAVAA